MTHTIKWTSGIEVVGGGPQKTVARTVKVDSYGVIAVDVKPNDTDEEVDIKIGSNSTGKVMLLAIASDKYTDISYKVNHTTATALKLDHPQVFFGAGAIATLYTAPDTAPDSLFFSNASSTEKASVQILIGRDAGP
jgi:hypothetical protein